MWRTPAASAARVRVHLANDRWNYDSLNYHSFGVISGVG